VDVLRPYYCVGDMPLNFQQLSMVRTFCLVVSLFTVSDKEWEMSIILFK